MNASDTRRDLAGLLLALLFGYGVGLLLVRVPSAYALLWWIGAPAATLASCSLIQRPSLLIPAAILVSLALIVSLWLNHGLAALMLAIFHTHKLKGGALRGLYSDLLSTSLLAFFASLMVAIVTRNNRHTSKTRRIP